MKVEKIKNDAPFNWTKRSNIRKKKSVRSIKNLVTISAKQTFIKELQGSFPNKANAMGN